MLMCLLFYIFHVSDLKNNRSDLDDLSEGEHYQGDNISVILCVEMQEAVESCPTPWADHHLKNFNSDILFSNKIESEETKETFGELISQTEVLTLHSFITNTQKVCSDNTC